jgi:hypothetical protein
MDADIGWCELCERLHRSPNTDEGCEFEDGVHQENADAARIDGGPVEPRSADSKALDDIALIMSGVEWDADTLQEISLIVMGTGRTIEDPDADSEGEQAGCAERPPSDAATATGMYDHDDFN